MSADDAREALATPPADPPQLDRTPNFSALEKWTAKLREWCDAAVDRIKELERVVLERDDKIHKLENDLIDAGDAVANHESMVEDIQDVQRGLKSWDEVLDTYRAELRI